MRRVLMLASVFPRWDGDDTPPFVQVLAEDVAKLGWGVTVLAPHAEGAARRERMGEIDVVRFRYAPSRFERLCYDGGMIVNLRREPRLRALLPGFLIAQVNAVRRQTSRAQYSLLHSHSLLPQGFAATLVTGIRGMPHVTTSHGNDIYALPKDGPYGWMKRHTLESATRVTVNSHAGQDVLRGYGVDEEKLRIIPASPNISPLQDAVFEDVRSRYRPPGGTLAMFAGRVLEEKGVGEVLEALALVRDELPDLRAIIVGEGPDRGRYEQLCRTLGLEDIVTFTGWVDRDAFFSTMAAADIFIGPSKPRADGWTEAQGLTFVEAMAAGTPVIASGIGGIPDMIKDGETGLLVQPGDAEGIAAGLRRYHAEPELRSRIRSNALKRYEEHFSRATVARRYVENYEELCR